ncbi:MAG: thioesterase family protein [Bacteroidota bacterium]
MFTCDVTLRIRYGETDQMGYVYYGRYAEFYEIGRTELMRKLGFAYKDFEARGVLLPVVSLSIKYIRPAVYDEQIIIRTTLRKMPTARITFYYEIFNQAGDLLNEAECHLVFTDLDTRKPTRPPQDMLQALQPFFN